MMEHALIIMASSYGDARISALDIDNAMVQQPRDAGWPKLC
jgi:hypothetical protein